MKTIDFLTTAKWIHDQFSAKLSAVLFGGTLQDLIHGMPANEETHMELIRSSQEMAILRERLSSHALAPDILKAFALDVLLDEEMPFALGRFAVILANKSREEVNRRQEVEDDFKPLFTVAHRWRAFSGCIKPIEQLTLPQQVVDETDFDDILTVELLNPSGVNPTVESVAGVLTHTSQLYAAIARLSGNSEFPALRMIYADSGSSIRVDLKGLGEPIKRVKELLIEGWNLIRFRKVEDFRQNNKAFLESLETVRKIQTMREDGVGRGRCLKVYEAGS